MATQLSPVTPDADQVADVARLADRHVPGKEPVRLNFRDRRKPWLVLELPEGDFTIDPNVFVDDMGEFVQIENAIMLPADAPDDEVVKATADAQAYILALIARSNPTAPAEIKLTIDECLEVIATLSSNTSALAEVVESLADPYAAVTPRAADADPPTPTSMPPSQPGSSGSEKPTEEATGGATSRGGSSRGSSGKPSSAPPRPKRKKTARG